MISWLNPYFLGGVVIAFALSFFGGYRLGHNLEKANFDAYKLEQAQLTQELKDKHQDEADNIRKDKDAKIADINAQLFNAVNELRKRPARPVQIASDGQSGTGASLYAEDAIFLAGEAARADILRSALQACYDQYDAVRK